MLICYHTFRLTMCNLHTCLICGQFSTATPLSTLSSARSTSILHKSTRLQIQDLQVGRRSASGKTRCEIMQQGEWAQAAFAAFDLRWCAAMMLDTVHSLQVTSCLARSIRRTNHRQAQSNSHAGASFCSRLRMVIAHHKA